MSEHKNRDCALAQDLMPLQLDNVCSPESSRFLTEHLQGCEQCRKVYQDMRDNYGIALTAPQQEGEAGRFRRLMRRHTMRRSLISVVIVLAALVVAVGLYSGLWLDKHHPLPLDRYEVTLQRTSSGWVFPAFTYQGTNVGYVGGFRVYGGMEGARYVMYITQYSSIIPERENNNIFSPRPEYYLNDGKLYQARYERNYDQYWIKLFASVDEIRQGTSKDYRVIYTAGDDIPLCSDELEQQINDKLWLAVYGYSYNEPEDRVLFVPLPGEAPKDLEGFK